MTAVVSLGSNLGDRAGHLAAAREILGVVFPVVGVSPIYETAPVGFVDQAAFLNQILLIDASDPEELLSAGHRAEEARGRVRNRRWGPRTLDVDVISVDALRSDSPRLTLPHPRAHERAFVLLPWLDVDPEAEVPGRGAALALLRRLDTSDVRRWAA